MNDFEEKLKEVEKTVKIKLATESRRATYIKERIEMCRKEVLPVIEKLNEAISKYDLIFTEYKDDEKYNITMERIEFNLREKSSNNLLDGSFHCKIAADWSNNVDCFNYLKKNGNYLLSQYPDNISEVIDAFLLHEMPKIIENKLIDA